MIERDKQSITKEIIKITAKQSEKKLQSTEKQINIIKRRITLTRESKWWSKNNCFLLEAIFSFTFVIFSISLLLIGNSLLVLLCNESSFINGVFDSSLTGGVFDVVAEVTWSNEDSVSFIIWVEF